MNGSKNWEEGDKNGLVRGRKGNKFYMYDKSLPQIPPWEDQCTKDTLEGRCKIGENLRKC